MIKIAVDCFGGDRSPSANVEGAVKALKLNHDIELVLFGDEEIIKQELAKFSYDSSRLSIVHAPQVVSCNDVPTVAVKTMKESSLIKAIETLRTDESYNALVTLGSTGALLAGCVLRLGRIRGVKRPAFCPLLPTVNKKFVGLSDSGANADCDEYYLQQFAIMGSLYLQKAYGIENPRVALLNVGVEEEKGDMMHKSAYQLLKNTPQINFVGNMESRDTLSGSYDLIIADGFSGNVLLKATEGACMELMGLLKKSFMENLKTKIGAVLLKKQLYTIKGFLDYNNYGGSVLLGCPKTVVKGHGGSKAEAVYHAIEQAYNMEKNNLCQAIGEELAKMTPPQE